MTTKHPLLVIGVGSIGERHLRCFQATDRVDLSICELNENLRNEVGERYNISKRFDNLETALEQKPDAALIAAPAHLHIPLAQTCAEAGCHLLIEKPLSTSTEGIAELKQFIAKEKLTASVAFVFRAHPVIQAMKTAIDSGTFGKPLQVNTISGQHFPTYRPAYRDIYYNNHAAGGGLIQDSLPHTMNAVEWLIGPTQQIMADAAHLKLEGVEVEDTVNVLTRHGANGEILGSFCSNQHQAPNETSITVICENATVRFDYQRNRWGWQKEPEGEWEYENFTIGRDDLFTHQANAFLDAIEGKTEPACTIAEAEHTLKTCLTILKSSQQPPWIPIPNS
ncbi:MAG: Gfo/Idh/MocA family oxidoreductase [Verrucomicrobia bacterium]|nr:Gfo/Idh/MocA family oxidoreductase [Verrucomicrobiota bacterium]